MSVIHLACARTNDRTVKRPRLSVPTNLHSDTVVGMVGNLAWPRRKVSEKDIRWLYSGEMKCQAELKHQCRVPVTMTLTLLLVRRFADELSPRFSTTCHVQSGHRAERPRSV